MKSLWFVFSGLLILSGVVALNSLSNTTTALEQQNEILLQQLQREQRERDA